jgi:hypothetical protein
LALIDDEMVQEQNWGKEVIDGISDGWVIAGWD